MRLWVCGLAPAVVASMLLGVGAAPAASFDCEKASGRIEKIVCDDPDLNSLDSQLEGAYLGALDRSLHPAQVTEDQRAWLKARDACAGVKCMVGEYQRRVAALSKISDDPAICSGASTPEINACGAEYTRRADRELDRYLAAARKRLTEEAKHDLTAGTVNTALAALDEAQARWLTFRKAECEAVYDWWSGGTIRGAMFEGCMEGLTKARTEEVWGTWLTYEDGTLPLMPKPTRR